MATKKKEQAAAARVEITLIKSVIGRLDKQKRTVEALGLKRIGHSVVKPDNEATRGMIFVVKHLVEVKPYVGA
ncbi:MAG: 50S ribosomal protein L30 [Clostridiales bacterium]|jgi:large subunit ribosomal protein L30|nr:50S ribosomal protein L30 [Clostridiales bacterium]